MSMPGKRIQFDDETWEAIEAVVRDSGSSFQDLTDEAFADLLKKHKQPVGLKASLKESLGPCMDKSERHFQVQKSPVHRQAGVMCWGLLSRLSSFPPLSNEEDFLDVVFDRVHTCNKRRSICHRNHS
jgi:hypothetical protein